MNLASIPNLICYMRMILVVPIVWLILNGEYGLTLVVFGIAGFSDALDGFLAKQFDWHSDLGALLDPLADKLLLVTAFVSLTWVGLLPLWLTLVVVIRDILIVSGAFAFHYLIGPVEGQPTVVSKLNTLFQILLVLAVVSQVRFEWPGDIPVDGLIAGVLITTVLSGADYVWSWGRRAWLAKKGL